MRSLFYRILPADIRIAPLVVLGVAAGLCSTVQAQPSGTLVGQCIENATCWSAQTPTAWSNTLNAAAIASLGRGSTINFVAGQTAESIIRLGVTTITFTTPGGPVVQTLGEFNGGDHSDPCNFCEVDTVGTFMVPSNATGATISGTFGNSQVPNSAGVNLYLGNGCVVPTTETTAFDGWDTAGSFGNGPNPTDGKWKQTITAPAGVNFAGETVQEADAGNGSDSCWFTGSSFAPFTALSGGTWTVNADNTWGDDFVGWFPNPVTYYRTQGRAPCGFTVHQQMTMMCSDGTFHKYGPVNTLMGSFTATTVTSVRAGGTATRRF